MINLMDKAMVALQAAASALKLYGPNHPASARQTALANETLGTLLASGRELRLIRLDNALLFDDTDLPSCAVLNAALIPAMASHGVEWIEFKKGLTESELLTFLVQLESEPAEAQQIGTVHTLVGRLGRSRAGNGAGNGAGTGAAAPIVNSAAGLAAVSPIDPGEHAEQLKQVWTALRVGGAVEEHRLADLVESIRLAVTVGADVCNQLAEVKHHDEYTFVHTVNVAILSAALGEAVGMTGNEVFDLILAALLHDVGKQRTPLEILNKPGRLDDKERRRMEQHTVDGAAILLGRRGMPDVAPIVAFEHHANVDGSGYPHLGRGRTGRPHLASQIVHVADVFDALRTNRPYRAALDEQKVRHMLLEGSGKAFDTTLVELFLCRVVKLSPASGETIAGEIIIPGTVR